MVCDIINASLIPGTSWDERVLANVVEAMTRGIIKNNSAVYRVPKTILRGRARNENKRVTDDKKEMECRQPIL